MASKPLLASTTSQPPRGPENSFASSTARTKARVDAESSTIKTLRMDPHSQAYYEPEGAKATNPRADRTRSRALASHSHSSFSAHAGHAAAQDAHDGARARAHERA